MFKSPIHIIHKQIAAPQGSQLIFVKYPSLNITLATLPFNKQSVWARSTTNVGRKFWHMWANQCISCLFADIYLVWFPFSSVLWTLWLEWDDLLVHDGHPAVVLHLHVVHLWFPLPLLKVKKLFLLVIRKWTSAWQLFYLSLIFEGETKCLDIILHSCSKPSSLVVAEESQNSNLCPRVMLCCFACIFSLD